MQGPTCVFWADLTRLLAARTSADLEKDFATIKSFGTSHIYLFCGFGVTSNGSFAVIPDPPQRWGVLSICRQVRRVVGRL